jgi:hypothetical protein
MRRNRVEYVLETGQRPVAEQARQPDAFGVGAIR